MKIFKMHEHESIDDLLTHSSKINNALISLGEPSSNDSNVRKIIRSVPKLWEVKATTLKELNDSKEMDSTIFMGNLKTHEKDIKA